MTNVGLVLLELIVIKDVLVLILRLLRNNEWGTLITSIYGRSKWSEHLPYQVLHDVELEPLKKEIETLLYPELREQDEVPGNMNQ